MVSFFLLIIATTAVGWVNCRNVGKSAQGFDRYSSPRRTDANIDYAPEYNYPESWRLDDLFPSIQIEMNSMFRSMLSSLDAMPVEGRRPFSDWFADSDSQNDEKVHKTFRDAVPRPSQRPQLQPSSSSTHTVYRENQVTRPSSSSSNSNRQPVFYTPSGPMDDFLGFWDRFQRQFMSILTELSKALDDDNDSAESFRITPWNNRKIGGLPDSSTKPTSKSTPEFPIEDNISSNQNDTAMDDATVETSSAKTDGSRQTIDADDSDGEPWTIEMSTSMNDYGKMNNADEESNELSIHTVPSPNDYEEKTDFDDIEISDTYNIGSIGDITTQDYYSSNEMTSRSRIQGEIEGLTSGGDETNESSTIDSRLNESYDVSDTTFVSSSGENSNRETSKTIAFREISETSQSSEAIEKESTKSDANVTSSINLPDDRETNGEDSERSEIESSDLPKTFLDSDNETIVPEISMPEPDTNSNANELDEIRILEIPETTSDASISAQDKTGEKEKTDETVEKSIVATLIDNKEKNESVDGNIKDNEISKDTEERKTWQNPISVGRFLKKVAEAM